MPRGACSFRAPCAAPPQSGQQRPGECYYHELPGPPPQSCSSGWGWRHSQGTPSPPPRPLLFRLHLLHLFLLFFHLVFLHPPSPAADPGRCSPDPGCRGAREGWWHRRTRFWRTSSGALVVRRVAVQNTPTSILPTRAPHPSHPSPFPRGEGDADSPTWWLQLLVAPEFGWG